MPDLSLAIAMPPRRIRPSTEPQTQQSLIDWDFLLQPDMDRAKAKCRIMRQVPQCLLRLPIRVDDSGGSI
jgi:hypothetical protein